MEMAIGMHMKNLMVNYKQTHETKHLSNNR
jgi:hypothetical protein